MTTSREFFEGLESRLDPAKTAGMTNSYVFEIDGAGTWRVDVDDGTVKVDESGGDADATIATTLVRTGRSGTNVTATLTQDDQVRLTVTAIMGDLYLSLRLLEMREDTHFRAILRSGADLHGTV